MAREYNFIYSRLVKDKSDMIGHIAYSLYKQEKVSWIEGHKQGNDGKEPTEEEFKKSAECYEKILEEFPQHEDVIFLLAKNYEFLGEKDKALSQYERLAQINPEYVGLCTRFAKICIEKEEIDKAKEYLKKEHKEHPFENEHYIYSMHICFLEDDFEKANRILDRLFAIGPNEDDLLIFKINNDLNLKLVEYSQELADLNERVKEYLEKNFNVSF